MSELAEVRLTLIGQAASKANSRKLATLPDGKGGKRAASIKSDEALAFERSALLQIPPRLRLRINCKVRMHIRCVYQSERSDLDESLVLDVLQDRWKRQRDAWGNNCGRLLVQRGVYTNDRLVRERHVYHAIDAKNPRVEVLLQPLDRPAFTFAKDDEEQMDFGLDALARQDDLENGVAF